MRECHGPTVDMGLMCSMNGWLELEMSAHRARFPLNELQASVHLHRTLAVARLVYANEFRNWAICVTPIKQKPIRILERSPGANDLVAWILAGGSFERCRRCGDDLRVAASGRCPECGASTTTV